MDKLIRELKREHGELFGLLEAFKQGRGVDGADWKEKLFSAKKLFQDHLKKEDDELYPRLLDKCSGDATMETMVRKFMEDMKKISAKTLDFLERYNSTSGGSDFMRDYAEMMVDLKGRMREEEEKLFAQVRK